LVGGPASTDDYDYQDLRTDYKRNEVATDYNAGFTGAVAALFGEYGGRPLPDSAFPPREEEFEEYSVLVKLNNSGANFVELRANIQNKSTAPAMARSDLYFRYFVNLNELAGKALNAEDIRVNAPYSQASSISQLKPWGEPDSNIYYTEIRFDKDIIYPGGEAEYRREVLFRISLPTNSDLNWNNSNDHSWSETYASAVNQLGTKAPNIPVYGAQGLLSGIEPALD